MTEAIGWIVPEGSSGSIVTVSGRTYNDKLHVDGTDLRDKRRAYRDVHYSEAEIDSVERQMAPQEFMAAENCNRGHKRRYFMELSYLAMSDTENDSDSEAGLRAQRFANLLRLDHAGL